MRIGKERHFLGEHCRVGAVLRAELPGESLDVQLDRHFLEIEAKADFLVGETSAEAFEYFEFPPREVKRFSRHSPYDRCRSPRLGDFGLPSNTGRRPRRKRRSA